METKNELALMPSQAEWSQIKEIAAVAIKSGLLPAGIKSPEAAAIIALKGRELGLPPMVAFSHIHVIQGKPTMSAEIMLAAIYQKYANADIVIAESTEEKCLIRARRLPAQDYTEIMWDVERAKKMGLLEKDNWKKQRGTMLKWRCISEMKRTVWPEVLMGIDFTKEEIEESSGDKSELKDVTPKTPESKTEVKSVRKEVKNFAPQTSEDAKNWKPAQATASPIESNPSQVEIEDVEIQPQQKSRPELIADLNKLKAQLKFTDDKIFFAECRGILNVTDNKFSDGDLANLVKHFQQVVNHAS